MKPTLAELDQRDLRDVAERIARAHGLTLGAMFTDLARPAPAARGKFYAQLREMGWSDLAIARFVGKDHSCVVNAIGKREPSTSSTEGAVRS